MNFIQSAATEKGGERGLTWSVLKVTGSWSELKSLITVVVIGKDIFIKLRQKSEMEGRVLSIVLKYVYQLRQHLVVGFKIRLCSVGG